MCESFVFKPKLIRILAKHNLILESHADVSNIWHVPQGRYKCSPTKNCILKILEFFVLFKNMIV